MKRLSSTILFALIGLIFFQAITNSTIAISNSAGIEIDQELLPTVKSLNITGLEGSENPNQKLTALQLGDNDVSAIWEDVPKTSVSAFGSNGAIASVWGENEVFFYVQHDNDLSWVAFQWDSDNSSDPENLQADSIRGMEKDDDMWIFGNARKSKISGDAYCVGEEGTENVETDILDDLYWERILVNDSDGRTLYTAWEISRVLVTNDDAGHDINFYHSTNSSLLLASDIYHGASEINVAKFALVSASVGGNFVPTDNPEPEPIKVGAFYSKHISIGVGIAVLTYVLTFIPTYFILKKEDI